MSTHPTFTGNEIVCQCHACTQARQSQIDKAVNSGAPTEMTSLREIKAKLDAQASSLNLLHNSLEVLAESQGKLLAALNELGGQIKGLGDGLADEIRNATETIQSLPYRKVPRGYRCPICTTPRQSKKVRPVKRRR